MFANKYKSVIKIFHFVVPVFFLIPFVSNSKDWDVRGKSTFDLRYFLYPPMFVSQKTTSFSPSGSIEPEFVYDFTKINRFSLVPFLRLDSDDNNRTHFDIRELSFYHFSKNWDLTVGVNKVFWGVTESLHLVDIINQTDLVEDINREKKLGQPMINLNLDQKFGILSFFILPGFRERTFSSKNVRLSGPVEYDIDNSLYESSKKYRNIDWATRVTMTFNNLDIALSHFNGTSREPRLLKKNNQEKIKLVPFYDKIIQSGLEMQLTTNNALWKAELISRAGHGDRFYAFVWGFEYTFYGVQGGISDLGLLVEYLYDNRDPVLAPQTFADNDIFIGFRWRKNDVFDSSLLFGGSWDHKTNAGFMNLEAERRLNDFLKVEINGRFFLNIPEFDPLRYIMNDDYIEAKLNWFF